MIARHNTRPPKALVNRIGWIVAGILGVLLPAGEVLAFSYSPSTLTYTVEEGTASPPAQTVTFAKKSLVPKNWIATATASWLMLSPASGTISTEHDTIALQVNPSGLSAGTYSSSFNIAVANKNGHSDGNDSCHLRHLHQQHDNNPEHTAESLKPQLFRDS